MSQGVRLAILGAGATGKAHAAGAQQAGFKLVGAADLIPDRLKSLASQFKITNTVPEAEKLVLDPNIDAVSICLPTHLHAPVAIAALKSGKHVLIEMPPASNSKDAKAIAKAAEKTQKTVLYAGVRRFGAPEQSAKQALDKGYAGAIYHARATWLRTRGVPRGTGWYADKSLSGGGAVMDLGLPMIDLLTHLMASKITSVYAVAHARLAQLPVEEAANLILRFESGASADLSVAWAINQPPSQAGTLCRLNGETGALDVYTPQGPVMHRGFDDAGKSKATPMKQPKLAGYAAMLRHFKDCIQGKAQPLIDAGAGVELMNIAEAVYKSIETGRAVDVR
jgi:predicted dehydrogenase